MLRAATILLALILMSSVAKADGVHPYSFMLDSKLVGGQILIDTNDSENSYFIKSGILGENAVVYHYNNINSTRLSGIQLSNTRIIAKHIDNSILYLLTIRSDSLFLAMYKNLELLNNLYISISPEATYQNVSFLSNKSNLLLKIADALYYFEFDGLDIKKINLLSEHCINYSTFLIDKENFIAFIEDNNENCTLSLIDSKGILFHKQIIPFSEEIAIYNINNSLLLQFGSETNDNSLIYTIDTKLNTVENSFWLEAPLNLTAIDDNKDIFYLSYRNSSYYLSKKPLANKANNLAESSLELAKEFVEPIYFTLLDDCIMIVFKNAIATYSLDLEVMSIDFFPIGRWFNSISEINQNENKLILSSNHLTIVFDKKTDDFWQIKSYIFEFWKYIIPLILLVLLGLIFNKNRHQKRLLATLLDLPATGFMFIIDKSGRLIMLNEMASKFLAIKGNTPLNRQFKYFFKMEQTLPILDFYEKNYLTKQTFSEKINIISEGNSKEWLCHIIPVRNIAGASRGVILTGMDITEQLERKRLTNWAQLAHDMQTNLSTIRLNAEHLDIDTNDNNKSRQKKIMHQVNVLMHRIRDVITVGRSDTLDISLVNSSEICLDVRSEFDEVVFPDVDFILELSNFAFNCDRQKLIRALRNAVENGIRALPAKMGQITISCYKDSKNSYFAIKDTGIGMNSETQTKFLTPYYTTGSTSGGSGIGTMIMLRVAELHGGKLLINSEVGKGTEIVFVLPNNK